MPIIATTYHAIIHVNRQLKHYTYWLWCDWHIWGYDRIQANEKQ
jgi:hypothetical protein